MAEIFISYARADRERAQALARALGRDGWSVWWDRDIPPGRTFDDVIEEALAVAKCVIVLWTRESIRSEWVKAEASEAARRHILVPVLADQVMPPLEFRRIQCASLLGADLSSNPDWSQLRRAVEGLVERSASRPTTSATIGAAAPPQASRPGWRAASALVGALVMVVGGWVAVALRPGPPADPPVAARVPQAQNTSARVDGGGHADAEPTSQPKPPDAPIVSPPRLARAGPTSKTSRAAAPPGESGSREEIVPAADPNPPPEAPDMVVTSTLSTPPSASTPIVRPPPPAIVATSFDVIYTHGVFRESGRLTVSLDGVQYAEPGGRSTFHAACGDLRRVQEMTVIVDGEQRMVELHTKDRVHRFTTANRAARNLLVSALSRTCGAR